MSEGIDIVRRAVDLSERCERNGVLTHTAFLTPAEQYALGKSDFQNLRFFGGSRHSERSVAFFLPFYMDEADLEGQYEDYITAVRSEARFSTPSHRDYLGALMSMGITRDSVGDIYTFDDTAYFYLLSSVASHVLSSLDKVGRSGVKLEKVPLSDVPVPSVAYREVTFTVSSFRLDSVLSGTFGISRTKAAEMIHGGLVSLNYEVCEKPDSSVEEGDIISARGLGKMDVGAVGGVSRKGRIFVTAHVRK